jgi:hypothetical protein
MQNPRWIIEGARNAPNSLENLPREKVFLELDCKI